MPEKLENQKDLLETLFRAGESRESLIIRLDALNLENGDRENLQVFICELGENEPVEDFSTTRTDVGNAKRLVETFGHLMRYNYERNRWLLWLGKRWQWDEGNLIIEMAKDTARSIYHEAAMEKDDNERNELAKHAKASESATRIRGMIELAQSSVPVKIEQLNADQFLLNANNGVIDLRTGELLPHQPKHLLTYLIPINYEPEAKSELWESFLNRIFKDNTGLIEYVQKSFGYAITGNQDEQALWFFYGAGANGKTTLTGVIRDVLGDYAIEIDPLAFAVDKNAHTGPNEAIASLYNKRFAAATEIKTGVTLDVALVKRMTGGEQLRCERKFEHGFNFTPTHKLFLSGNHEPRITDTTNSIWNRLKYVPFTVSIPENERIKGLRNTLTREHGQSVLAWLVAGCLKWQREGLTEPPEVKAAIQTYRDSQDVLHDFLQEHCLIQSGESITVKDLFSAYKSWAENNDTKPLGKISFGNRLKEKNFKQDYGNRNIPFWYGIRIYTASELSNLEKKQQELTLLGVSVNSVNKNLGSPIEKSSRIETSEKSLNTFNRINTLASGELPNCPECGVNSWQFTPMGEVKCLGCGYKEKCQ